MSTVKTLQTKNLSANTRHRQGGLFECNSRVAIPQYIVGYASVSALSFDPILLQPVPNDVRVISLCVRLTPALSKVRKAVKLR